MDGRGWGVGGAGDGAVRARGGWVGGLVTSAAGLQRQPSGMLQRCWPRGKNQADVAQRRATQQAAVRAAEPARLSFSGDCLAVGNCAGSRAGRLAAVGGDSQRKAGVGPRLPPASTAALGAAVGISAGCDPPAARLGSPPARRQRVGVGVCRNNMQAPVRTVMTHCWQHAPGSEATHCGRLQVGSLPGAGLQ